MSKETLKANLREIPDFPIPGILFYDVTTLFKNPECLQEILDTLYEMYKDKGITKVVGIESRGFIMGGALAARLGAGFVMARKPGKLPAEVVEETYAKEYGTDTIQIHKDAIDENDVVLLHDDLLATGGTMAATHRFIMGGALAARLGAGFVMARKPGKLPAEVVEETYAKEYGTDTIQIHKDAIDENDVVLLHDDLLATGGTMAATHRLVQRCGAKKIFINFIIELGGLNGRKAFPEDITVDTLLTL